MADTTNEETPIGVNNDMDVDSAVAEIVEHQLSPSDREPAPERSSEKAAPLPADDTAATGQKPDSEAFSEPKPEGSSPAPNPNSPEPPSSLTKEAKEQWNSWPEAAQKEFLKREDDFHKGFQQVKPVAELGMGIGKILSPFLDTYRQYGVNPFDHIENLTTYHHMLMFGRPDQKAEIITGLARDAGVDLRSLVDGTAPAAVSDEVSSLQRELATLRAQLTNVNGRFAQQDNEAVYAHVKAVSEDTANFPYFWDVAQEMVKIATEQPSINIEKAYKIAIAESAIVQEKILQARMEERTRKAQEDAAKAAKARGVRLSSSSPVAPASGKQSKVTSVSDAVDDVFADLTAGN